MNTTLHAHARMSQRGINKSMIDMVLTYGSMKQDKYVFGKKEALQRLQNIQQEERVLKKIIDKGGLIVVAQGEAIITTYNY